MARENKASVPAVISNQEILAEINLISQIQQIETRLATDPDSIRFAQLADAYLGIGNFDQAIELCEQGLKMHPQYDTGMLVLTKSYYLSGNKKKAREILQDFLISHPASLAGHKLLGDLSLEEDDVAGTVSHYRIALRFDPINRQIIQTLVDLKDKYQKIKESKTSEDEEEQVIPAIVKKADSKIVPAEKPLEKIQPVADEKPVIKPVQVKEETKLDSFIEDAIQPSEDKFAFKLTETEPVKTESVIAKKEEKPKAEDKRSEFAPVYTDEKGIMYFYDDDEVSFDQYKKRLDLQKAGQALILERTVLDQKLAEIGVKTAVKAQTEISKDDVFAQTESAFDMEITPKGFEFEPKTIKVEEKPGKEELERASTFEEHIDESMAREEEELLSEAEQEAALSDIEISYKDYLDILTNEEDLLEALFQEEHEAGLDEDEDVAGKILRSAMGEEEPVVSIEEADQPIAYLDYVQNLESESEIQEASFIAEPLADEKEETINFGEFSAYLDHSDDTIDYHSYSMLLEATGISPDTLWENQPAVIEEPVLNYKDYITSASDAERADAFFEVPVTEVKEKIVKEEIVEKEIVKEEITVKPVIEEVITEIKTVEEEKIDLKPVEQQPVVLAEAVKEKEEEKPIAPPEVKEEISKAEDEYEEEYFEEEINPQDATQELVEKLAARGQFGSAYKVCKMLKVKNPTDAKVDRKILELKRLYVWSSQMVG